MKWGDDHNQTIIKKRVTRRGGEVWNGKKGRRAKEKEGQVGNGRQTARNVGETREVKSSNLLGHRETVLFKKGNTAVNELELYKGHFERSIHRLDYP